MIICTQRPLANVVERHAKVRSAAAVEMKSPMYGYRDRPLLLVGQDLLPKMLEAALGLDRDRGEIRSRVSVAVGTVIVRSAELDDVYMLFQVLDKRGE